MYGDSGNFEISTDGIEAGVRADVTEQAYFGKPGSRYQVYNGSGNGSWADPEDTSSWFGNQDDTKGKLFDRVSAATRFTIGGGTRRYLIINEKGTEIMEWFSSDDKFNGPGVIN